MQSQAFIYPTVYKIMPKMKQELDGTDLFFCIVMYIQLKEIIEKVNVGWDLVLFMVLLIGCRQI